MSIDQRLDQCARRYIQWDDTVTAVQQEYRHLMGEEAEALGTYFEQQGYTVDEVRSRAEELRKHWIAGVLPTINKGGTIATSPTSHKLQPG
jgi:hypothetical protein